MKKKLFVCIFFAMVAATAFAKDKKMYVTVQEASIKEKGSSLSKNIAVLPYGTEVIVTKKQGNWSYCYSSSDNAIIGWISTASLNSRKPSQSGSFSGSAEEIALAGKGWSEEVENLYKSFGTLNFDAVNRMEAMTVSQGELSLFVLQGYLEGAEE